MGFARRLARLAPVFALTASCAGGQASLRAGVFSSGDVTVSCTDRSAPPVIRTATMNAGTAQMFGDKLRAKDDALTTTINGEDNSKCAGRARRTADVSCMVANDRLREVKGAKEFAIHAPKTAGGPSYMTFTGGDVSAYRGEVEVTPVGKGGQKMMLLGTGGESLYCTWKPSK